MAFPNRKFSVADTWIFVRAEVEGMDADIPALRVEYSGEYTEKIEEETIFKIIL